VCYTLAGVGQLTVPWRPEPAGQPVRLAPRPPLLAGREELLAELHAQLTPGPGDAPGPQMVTLYGLAGAGKTSVAVKYAHCHLRP
jgi:hypothetical protein